MAMGFDLDLVPLAAFVVVGFEPTSGLVVGLVLAAGGLVLVGFVVVVLVVVSFSVPRGFVVLLVMSSRSDFGGESSLRTMEGGTNCRARRRNAAEGTFPDGWSYSGFIDLTSSRRGS